MGGKLKQVGKKVVGFQKLLTHPPTDVSPKRLFRCFDWNISHTLFCVVCAPHVNVKSPEQIAVSSRWRGARGNFCKYFSKDIAPISRWIPDAWYSCLLQTFIWQISFLLWKLHAGHLPSLFAEDKWQCEYHDNVEDKYCCNLDKYFCNLDKYGCNLDKSVWKLDKHYGIFDKLPPCANWTLFHLQRSNDNMEKYDDNYPEMPIHIE